MGSGWGAPPARNACLARAKVDLTQRDFLIEYLSHAPAALALLRAIECRELSAFAFRPPVLDLGCGNGTTAIWLNNDRGCQVTGVDLSGVRVDNAKKARTRLGQSAQDKLAFEKASATELPFADGTFTHIWSQAVIYHVPDKETVLKETYRVLKDGGIMVFDDLIKPKSDISADAQKFVYDRLLYDTPFNFDSYQDALKAQGFKILEAHDLSAHLKNSYILLAGRVPTDSTEHAEHYAQLANSYIETARAVDNNELGWGFYICQK